MVDPHGPSLFLSKLVVGRVLFSLSAIKDACSYSHKNLTEWYINTSD